MMEKIAYFYRQLYRIRAFEQQVLEGFSHGVFGGTTHTCLGQEANAVGVITALAQDDIVFSNHRSHGHFLAYGGDMTKLFAELMGKPSGVCHGWAGSQHLHYRNFFANGIQGGMMPCAVGMALTEKKLGRDTICVAFLGDGTLGEGIVYESFNLASLWQVPLLFVVEDNRIAQTTPTINSLAGSMRMRFEAFNIPVAEKETCDVMEIFALAKEVSELVRRKASPFAIILHGVRLGPHSKGDDTRSEEEMNELWSKHDGVNQLAIKLPLQEREIIEQEIEEEVKKAYQFALEADVYE